jgi:hypothetical protein
MQSLAGADTGTQSPGLVILSAAKNLVPQHPNSTFLTPMESREKKATSRCRTSIFTEFTLSVAEGFRMTKAGRVLLSHVATALSSP